MFNANKFTPGQQEIADAVDKALAKGERSADLGTRGGHDGHERRNLKLAIVASLIGTTALSVFGTIAANTGDSEPISDAPVEASLGMQDVIPGPDKELNLPGGKLTVGGETVDAVDTGEVVTKSIRIPNDELAKYARHFSNSPESDELTGKQEGSLRKAVEKIQSYLDAGYSLVSIDGQGFASPEDEATDASGGAGSESKLNQELATKRGEVVMQFIEDSLGKLGIDISKVASVKAGVEVESDEITTALADLASKRGQTMYDMMEGYNLGDQTFTQQELDQLDELLKENRYVKVNITVIKDSSGEGPVDGYKGGFSIVVIPILIPLIRRRFYIPPKPKPTPPPNPFPNGPGKSIDNPRKIGGTKPGHGKTARHHKQPTFHNNGSRSKSLGHRDGRM